MSNQPVLLSPSGPARERIERQYRTRTARSAALHREASAILPGGVGRNILYHRPYPVFMAHARGGRLEDVDGHEYIDLCNNYTAVILGHNPPEVTEQLARVPPGLNWAAPHPWEVELAAELVRRIPSVEQVRFTNSGTEATLFALRLARAATGRSLVAKFEGGYHGMHDYVLPSVAPALSEAGSAADPRAVGVPGIPRETIGTLLVLPFNDHANAERLIRAHADRLAAVIVEPVQGVAGMIPPEPGFLELLRSLTRELGVILIFDEVISLRLAEGGAQALFGVTPDLTAMGKIIGGGFAIGAFGGQREIMSLVDPSGADYRMSHSGTFTGPPATMAAGLASMRALTPRRLAQLNAAGDRFRAQLQGVLRDSGLPVTVTGIGSLFNVHGTAGPVVCYRDVAAGSKDLMAWLHLALLNEGMVLAPRGMGALSLAHTESDLDQVLTAFVAAARAVLA